MGILQHMLKTVDPTNAALVKELLLILDPPAAQRSLYTIPLCRNCRARLVGSTWPAHRARSTGDLKLTPEEVDLLAALADGHTLQSATRPLHARPDTLKARLANAKDALDCEPTQAAAVAAALRAGIIE